MSSRESNKEFTKSDEVPILDPRNLFIWQLRMKALMAAKKVLWTIQDHKKPPVVNAEHEATLNRAQKEEYRAEIERLSLLYPTDNAIAFDLLVRGITPHPEAMTVLYENATATAGQLWDQVDMRFNDSNLVGALQSKLAQFNSMDIDTAASERSPSFIGRISRALVEINQSGSGPGSKLSLDIHGVGRLKEGLLHDPRYKGICHVLRGQSEIKWAEAVKQLYAFERSEEATLGAKQSRTSRTSTPAQGPDHFDTLRRMLTDVIRGKREARKPYHLRVPGKAHYSSSQPKKKKRHLQCYICKGYGHRASECKKKKLVSAGKQERWHSQKPPGPGNNQMVNLRMLRHVPPLFDTSVDAAQMPSSPTSIVCFRAQVTPDTTSVQRNQAPDTGNGSEYESDSTGPPPLVSDTSDSDDDDDEYYLSFQQDLTTMARRAAIGRRRDLIQMIIINIIFVNINNILRRHVCKFYSHFF